MVSGITKTSPDTMQTPAEVMVDPGVEYSSAVSRRVPSPQESHGGPPSVLVSGGPTGVEQVTKEPRQYTVTSEWPYDSGEPKVIPPGLVRDTLHLTGTNQPPPGTRSLTPAQVSL